MKHFLFIISRPPYGSSHGLEQLDAAMVAAAFDGNVTILLRDEGVWHLQQQQAGEILLQKTASNVLSALPSYEIKRLYVCEPSLGKHAVKVDGDLGFRPIGLAEQKNLISGADVVIGGQP